MLDSGLAIIALRFDKVFAQVLFLPITDTIIVFPVAYVVLLLLI